MVLTLYFALLEANQVEFSNCCSQGAEVFLQYRRGYPVVSESDRFQRFVSWERHLACEEVEFVLAVWRGSGWYAEGDSPSRGQFEATNDRRVSVRLGVSRRREGLIRSNYATSVEDHAADGEAVDANSRRAATLAIKCDSVV